jgi:hypothetical protein
MEGTDIMTTKNEIQWTTEPTPLEVTLWNMRDAAALLGYLLHDVTSRLDELEGRKVEVTPREARKAARLAKSLMETVAGTFRSRDVCEAEAILKAMDAARMNDGRAFRHVRDVVTAHSETLGKTVTIPESECPGGCGRYVSECKCP